MRLRLAVLATLVTTLAAGAVSSVANAAPRHNRGLTIAAVPNPIDAGDGVFIYGQLNATPVGGQTIVLYHHLAGSGLGYTKVGRTTTDSHGFYEFTRAEGVVMTNRSWFVREQGIHQIHSRTVFERVSALVSLAAGTTTAVTGQPVTFTGSVTPNHAFERVVLQEQGADGNWRDLKSGRLDGGSNYSITYRWRFAGDHTVRVLFPSDFRNIAGSANPGHGGGSAEAGAGIHDLEFGSADLLWSVGDDLGRARSVELVDDRRGEHAGDAVGAHRLSESVHSGRRHDHGFGR